MLSISRIKIINFRQFKDIDLKLDGEKNIYLFIGKNGTGKSNFLNAVYWCLYAKQPFKFHEDEKKLLNEEAQKKNQYDEVKVSIEIKSDDDKYLFTRTIRETQDSQFSVMLYKKGDWIPLDNPNVVVNNFLPEEVSKFFLFDGEAVQNLYKGNYSSNLKDGVLRVSEVSLLDRASQHLERTRDQARDRASRGNPDTEKIEEEITELKENKESFTKKLSEVEDANTKLKEKRDILNEKLKKFEKYKDLRNRKLELEENLEQAKVRLDEYQNQIDDLIIKYSPFWYLKDNLIKVADKINSENTQGHLPPKIKDTFIDELIQKGICICGTDINKDSSTYKSLKKLRDEVSPLNRREYLIEDKVEINNLIKELNNIFPNNMKDLRMKKSRERQDIDNTQIQLKEIVEGLKKAPEEEVGNIAKTYSDIDEQVEENSQKIGQLKHKLKEIDEDVSKKEEEQMRLNKKKEQFEKDKRKLDLLEESKDKIDYIRQRLVDGVRKSVSLNTDRYFKDLIWKKDEFDKVNFNDNYEVEVNKRGESSSSLKILSTGEMKVLSFATIKALGQLSGFNEVPLFIDGPLENLDKEVEESFLETLPSFVAGKQAFLFSLDHDVIIEFGKEKVNPKNFFLLTREKGSKSTIIKQYQ
jgi:DNA sulfur modification protein DndD